MEITFSKMIPCFSKTFRCLDVSLFHLRKDLEKIQMRPTRKPNITRGFLLKDTESDGTLSCMSKDRIQS